MSDKVINITSNGIKQAIDDLVNENEMLQDKVYKLEDIIKEAREYLKQRIKDVEDEEISYVEMTSKAYIIEQKELLEILDKVGSDKE